MPDPIDFWLPVRQSVVKKLKAYSPLTDLISASSIYGEQPSSEPAWPLIRIGLPISTGFEATGWAGSVHRVTVHVFCKGRFTDAVANACKQVVAAMQDDLVISGLGLVDLQWAATNVLRDGEEASSYHGVCDFDLTVVTSD